MVFEPAFSALFEPASGCLSGPISIRKGRLIVRHLTGILTDSLKRIRARIGKPGFALWFSLEGTSAACSPSPERGSK